MAFDTYPRKRRAGGAKGDALGSRPRRSKRLLSTGNDEAPKSGDPPPSILPDLSLQASRVPLASQPHSAHGVLPFPWNFPWKCTFPRPLEWRMSGRLTMLVAIGVLGLWMVMEVCKRRDSGFPPVPSSIAKKEMEDFFHKSAKWMHSQIDAAEVKVVKEVSGLKSKIEEKLDQKASGFESEIRKFRSDLNGMENSIENVEKKIGKKVASLGTSINGLKTQVKRVETFLAKFLNDEGSMIGPHVEKVANQPMLGHIPKEGFGKEVDLEDARTLARGLVIEELEKHVADGVGRPDYALKSGGGKVLAHSESYIGSDSFFMDMLRIKLFAPLISMVHPLANKILEPSFGEPGQCLALKGSNVFVEIMLRSAIYLEAITLEHVSKLAAYDISTAPKHVQIFGLIGTFPEPPSSDLKDKTNLVANFTYDINKNSLQTFLVNEEFRNISLSKIRLQVDSNHGNPKLTCIYRLRVHGTQVNSTNSDTYSLLPPS